MLVQVQGPKATYGNLKFVPNIDSREHSLDITGFTIKRDGTTYEFEDLPVSKCLPAAALEDIVINTFEMDDDERTEFLEIDFFIPDFDERARIHFRAVENPAWPDHLLYEVEDQGGDWLSIGDVLLVELLPPSFQQIMESGAMSQITDHSLDYLPMAAE